MKKLRDIISKQPSVYFAHPISDYGGSRQKAAFGALAAQGWKIESPDHPKHQEGYKKYGQGYHLETVKNCDKFAFMRFPDGCIGAGVTSEIKTAREHSKPIYEVRGKHLHDVTRDEIPGPFLSPEETRKKRQEFASAEHLEKYKDKAK